MDLESKHLGSLLLLATSNITLQQNKENFNYGTVSTSAAFVLTKIFENIRMYGYYSVIS